MKIKALEDFLESCPENYCACIGVEKCEAWAICDGDNVYWKGEDGVYSGWMFEGLHKSDSYSICNLDTQQRVTTTAIFENSFRISYDEFEDKYGDEM